MIKFGAFPFIRLLIPFITGILLYVYFLKQIPVPEFSVLLFLLLAVFLFTHRKWGADFSKNWVNGIVLNVFLVVFGITLTELKTQIHNKGHFSNYLQDADRALVRVIEPVKEKERSVAAKVEVLEVNTSENPIASKGKAIIYFKKDENSLHLNYGDELLVHAKFAEVEAPKNPGEFDYKRYLAFHNIYHQSYLKAGEWNHTNYNSGNGLFSSAYKLRYKLLESLQKEGFTGDEYSVISALLLGYEDKLDKDIISAYANTGALHVLSVSGLHVGLIFIVFNFLFGFFDKIKRGNILKALLLLFILWFYAFLTGLSPSVLRSTVMFSVIVLAGSFSKNSNIFNTLALSCFVLLLFDPYLIMNVGFQLSYCAVLGIVLFYQRIYSWIELRSWLSDQLWKMTSVSIAAQLMTFPLGLLYFHQFPNYFLFSNLVVIPLSTITMYAGLLFFLFSWVPVVGHGLAWLLKMLVMGLNWSVKLFEEMPFPLIDQISISVVETWLIFAVIISACLFFIFKKYYWLITSLSFAVIISFMQLIEKYGQLNQQKMFVYNTPKTMALDLMIGNRNYLITDSVFANNEQSLMFHVKHNWWEQGVSDNRIILLNDSVTDEFICYNKGVCTLGDKKIVILSKEFDHSSCSPFTVDYLIVKNSGSKAVEEAILKFSPKQLIYAGTFSQNYAAKRPTVNPYNPKVHMVSIAGCFEADLSRRID